MARRNKAATANASYVAAYRERQLKLGRKQRALFLTDEELERVNRFVYRVRRDARVLPR